MVATKEISKKSKSTPSKKAVEIPAALVRETIDGIPFYYAGYRSVLDKKVDLEGITADGGFRLFLKDFFFKLLISRLDSSRFAIFMGNIGCHFDDRTDLSLGVAVYDKKILTPDKITAKYIGVTPKIVIEIDVNVEMAERNENIFEEFVLRKVKKLFEFGAEKIVWVFSKSKTVIVARPGGTWDVVDWDQDVELADGIIFNIAKYLKEEGIKLETEE